MRMADEHRDLVRCGQELMAVIAALPQRIKGIDKLHRLVQAELDFLQNLQCPSLSLSATASTPSTASSISTTPSLSADEQSHHETSHEAETAVDQTGYECKLASSNLHHLHALVEIVEKNKDNVVAVLKKVKASVPKGPRLEATIDVVAAHGLSWIKVTARKAIALQLVWEGNTSFQKRSIVDQCQKLYQLSKLCPVGHAFAAVTVVFAAGVTTPMKAHLEKIGVSVVGDIVPYECGNLNSPESSDAEDDAEADIQTKQETELTTDHKQMTPHHQQSHTTAVASMAECEKAHRTMPSRVQTQLDLNHNSSDSSSRKERHSSEKRTEAENQLVISCRQATQVDGNLVYTYTKALLEAVIILPTPNDKVLSSEQSVQHLVLQAGGGQHFTNLDVSSMVLLASDVSYGLTPSTTLCDPLLVTMAEEEEKSPALPEVLECIRGTRLIVCQTALKGFLSIVNTIAGPREKQRAKALVEACHEIPDLPCPFLAPLELSGKVKPRTKSIFSAGATLGVPTLTANHAFLRAASEQGIHVLVKVHAGRALTETQTDRWIRRGKPPRANADYYFRRAKELKCPLAELPSAPEPTLQ
eukprot:m.92648 g.92648  ORF g.92648 m.92648 type:complete len:586 (+) comp14672_c2_seq2:131-1888(+)